MRKMKKEGMQQARLPEPEMTLYAIIYNAGGGETISMRAFEDEQAAWSYGRIMGIEPKALIVRDAGVAGKTKAETRLSIRVVK